MSRPDLLRVTDLSVSFGSDPAHALPAVQGLSFSVPRNSSVALVGESGSGKSVTALAVMGLLTQENTIIAPESRIFFEGQNILDWSKEQRRKLCAREMSIIFQEPMTSLNPVLTVGCQISEVLRCHMGHKPAAARSRAMDLLEEVGLSDPRRYYHTYPSQLSGGQQQRVMIAIAIACEPKLLIADEPTTALDVCIQRQIFDLLERLRARHEMSVLFISHNLALVGEVADSVVVMRDGQVREQGSARRVFLAPIDPYTSALLNCHPSRAARSARPPARCGDEIVLDVRSLRKTFYRREGVFKRRALHAYDDVSFQLRRGKTLGIVGESGSGKTTLGLTLACLHPASAGEVLFKGRDLCQLRGREILQYKRQLQFVFQNPYASLNPHHRVGAILLEPMRIHDIGEDDEERFDTAVALLARVGLPASTIHRYPHELSGGQRQRIAIARSLTLKPEVLICDESVSALDVLVQAQVLDLLQDLQQEYAMSYVFISHDLEVVKRLADEVIVMKQGQVLEKADADALFSAPSHPYTRELLQAIPRGFDAGPRIRAQV